MVVYRLLSVDEVDASLFAFFKRTQLVTKRWRKVEGEWSIQEVSFVDDWTAEEFRDGIAYLRNLVQSNGYVVGAFYNGQLKGFMSVEPAIFGNSANYINLSNLHVSQDMRAKGIGRELFGLAKKWAIERNAQKLYISGNSAVESQAFYKAMGCVEAVEYNQKLVEKEPCDCQLEYVL